MGKKYKFTEEQLDEITAAKAKNKNKRIDKRLTVLELSGKGVKRAEIALITGYNIGYIPKQRFPKSYPQMKPTIAILLEIFLHFTQTNWDFERLLNRYLLRNLYAAFLSILP